MRSAESRSLYASRMPHSELRTPNSALGETAMPTTRGPTFKTDNLKLAAQGGRPVFAQGPPGWPLHDEDIRVALERAYAQGDWGRYHGSQCAALTEELAAFHRVPHVMLCSSGTIAVELALRGLGVGPGDEVLLAGYDFAGNFRAVEACGARPVLVDVDP